LALNAMWHVGCIEEASCVCKAEANIVVEQGPYSLVLPTSDVASIHVCWYMYRYATSWDLGESFVMPSRNC
jgi:hypothetical protein